jgi:hypothetical protein
VQTMGGEDSGRKEHFKIWVQVGGSGVLMKHVVTKGDI